MELPRHVHRYGGEYLIVRTQADYDEALADGWHHLPPQSPPELEPDPDDTPTVFTGTAVIGETVVTPKRRGRPPRKTEG